jgi:molecular chaperone HtpG
MTGGQKSKISFEVETSRILKILTSEIYDSPKAFLRENVQNAYDAILMRCTAQNLPVEERQITVTLNDRQLIVSDDGIGMTETVLTENFWKAGSSGKKSDLALRSGVIGTFGIGAMANFGVCKALRVETRHIESDVTLITVARREDLRIAEDCIDLERVSDDRDPGTTVVADLDPSFATDVVSVKQYLAPYVRFLRVPVLVNGESISQISFEATLGKRAAGFETHAERRVKRGTLEGTLRTLLDSAGRLLTRLTDVSLSGQPIAGELFLHQNGGQTHGFRNLFGLAPMPVSSAYNFGGFVNLGILHPTAGREALSRESIQHVANLVAMIEAEATKDIANTPAADSNQEFQQYLVNNKLTLLAKNVTVHILPAKVDVPLGGLKDFEPGKPKLYYAGRDASLLKRFATEKSNLVQVSMSNPRRQLQLRYLETSKIQQAPDTVVVDRLPASVVGFDEAMFVLRIRAVLLEDYLMPDVDVALANISHGVAVHVGKTKDGLQISVARDMPAAKLVVECYNSARDVFDGFVIDFVREHLYSHIRDQVPSSTRQGRDALYKRLQENKDLFRYDAEEYGEVESLLTEYLSGKTDLEHVLRASAGRAFIQRQEVSKEQVGTVEQEMPDIINAVAAATEPPADVEENVSTHSEAAPAILRLTMTTEKKVLTVAAPHDELNGFQMFLALSDRAVKTEGEFFRWPHTTKLIWGSHRVIYIFTDATGGLSLYYDIELKEPLETDMTGGATFPTTTIITKDRIYVPVPKELEAAFQITTGAKEFYVRFDTIP